MVVMVTRGLAYSLLTLRLGFHALVPIFAEQELTAEQWDSLAQCESSGRWFVNTGNGYYGGLQIDEETWIEHGGQRYTKWPHYASKEIQILVAEDILADQGLDAWPVCSYIVGLR